MEFDGHKLKALAYVIRCEHHHNNLRFKAEYTWLNCAFKDFVRSITEIGGEIIENLTREQVQYDVETKDFYGYSTLMFIFYLNCPCDSVYYVNIIHKTLQTNERLRCITKIVLDYSFGVGCARSYEAEWRKGVISIKWLNEILLNGEYVYKSNEYNEIKKHTIVSSSAYILPTVDNLVFISCKLTGNYYNKTELDQLGYEEYKDEESDDDYDDEYEDSDAYDEEQSYNDDDGENSENEILYTFDSEYEASWKSKNTPKDGKLFFQVMIEYLSQYAKRKSIQEICCEVTNQKISEMVVFENTSSGGCYFFNINPALFIAINHLTFRNFDTRTGAEKDIEAIKKLCTLHRIPHLIIEDGSAEQVQKLMHLIQNTNLSLLKNLFIAVMSHGDNGDIIYTKTSSYTVDDIKTALFKNKSLRNVETLLFLNMCRGGFDPRYEVEPQPLVPTDASDLDDTTVVLYSARKGCVSLRTEYGSVAVQKFTELFQKSLQKFSLREVHAQMENDLLEENFDFEAMTELCSSQGVDHVVSMEFQNFGDFMELYQKFEIAAITSSKPYTA